MENWINAEVLYRWIDFEGLILLSLLAACTWLFYRVFLRDVSDERHRNIKFHLRGIARNYLFLLAFFCLFLLLSKDSWLSPTLFKLKPYFALLAYSFGLVVFIKLARLFSLMYLFMGSMQAGVPLLIVNIFTLLLSVTVLFWSLSHIFGIQLGPLLATSAAFSIVLGLALQDTLGNLVAGVALQLDNNFQIGNWLEVVNGVNKSVGQVKEISWRSTTLLGLSDEIITIPNRVMAGAQIHNFSPDQPTIKSLIFRVDHDADTEKICALLERAAQSIPDVRGLPTPLSYIQEITPSWTQLKLLFWIDSYGSQFSIGDKVYRKSLEMLAQEGIRLSTEIYEYRMVKPALQ